MIKIVEIYQTCNVAPSQWDAWTDEGEYIYIRHRWGILTISRGAVLNVVLEIEPDSSTTSFLSYADLVKELATELDFSSAHWLTDEEHKAKVE